MRPKTLSYEWIEFLEDEFDKSYFLNIVECYKKAQKNTTIFPKSNLIFKAFNLISPQNIKIVILGQDPYHGSHIINGVEIPQAMGLSFSVPKGIPIPPSLNNIYKEIEQSLHIKMPNHGDLSQWSKRGILLLNSILSVQKGMANSHKNFGWEIFTDAVISKISSKLNNIIFMLWGNFAKKKMSLIDTKKHHIITAPHPSPLAKGFVGSGVFFKANQILESMGQETIDWSIRN